MEFELEYNAVVNKNKNLFYFKNYCLDHKEFRDWLKHNDISVDDFESLNEDLSKIYLRNKYRGLMSFIKKNESILNDLDDFDDNNIDSLITLREIYFHYYENRYYINLLAYRGFSIFKNYYNDFIEDINIILMNNEML